MLKVNLHRFFRFTCDGKYSQKDINRFIKYIKINLKTDCWNWAGTVDRSGYGVLTVNKKTIKTHRMAVETATNKLISDGKSVCHHCDNPRCVNVLVCLFLGTHQDNMKDRDNKGRCSRLPKSIGEKHSMSKLTHIQVKEIRIKWITGNYLQWQLAEEYGISDVQIGYIVNNKSWYDKDYIPPKFKNKRSLKLSYDEEDKIRELYATGKYTMQQLANVYGIHRITISKAISNNIIRKVG